MEFKLERQEYTNLSTIGSIYLDGDFICYSLELPYIDNQPFISCIPPDDYDLVPHNSDRHPNHFALIGGTVSHFPEPGKERSTILIHKGNFPHEINGCIAVGELKDRNQVIGSKAAFDRLMELIRQHDIKQIKII
jgi:hypothetical protein